MNLKMKRIYAIALLLGLPLSENLLGQGQSSQKIIFHVTAVRQNEAQDYCTEANCSATRFTVEGYSDASSDSRIQYLLECVEVIPNGTVHPTIGAFIYMPITIMQRNFGMTVFTSPHPPAALLQTTK